MVFGARVFSLVAFARTEREVATATRSAARVCVVPCVLALLSLSCGGSQTPHAANASPSIVVRDRGQAPRQRLRYAPAIGTVERVELRFKFSIDTAFTNTVLEKGERKANLPAIRAVGHFEVTAIEPNGDARIRGAIDHAELLEDVRDPRLRRTIDAEVEVLERWRASWRRSPVGVIAEVRVDPSSGVAPHQLANVIEAIRESSVVFPDESVGVGAIWERSSRMTACLRASSSGVCGTTQPAPRLPRFTCEVSLYLICTRDLYPP